MTFSSNRAASLFPRAGVRLAGLSGRFLIGVLLIGAYVLGVAGCQREVTAVPAFSGEKISFEVKDRVLRAEVAVEPDHRRTGLMFRTSLPKDDGMLFIFEEERAQSFHMKNTYVPLSIAFLDRQGKILQIEDMQPKDEGLTASKYKVRFALEVNQGWFREVGLSVGDSLPGFSEKVARFARL